MRQGCGSERIAAAIRGLALGTALIVILASAACYPAGIRTDEGNSPDAAPPAASPAEASETLGKLEVAPPGSMAGYSRERFPHWSDAQENGWDAPSTSCNVRDAALIRDGEAVEVGDGCDVSSGEWLDPYTGSTYADPSEIDIDHVVPLAEAWRNGASSWDEARRERYANDPDVLLSVEDNANQSKGDKGPEAWKPPREAVWCDYATQWIGIKEGYDLTVDEREKAALEEMLGTCAEGG
ncbi:MAG: HNH endonuclease family protein [Actinomycetota bacterium]|nr:HNH endonuclease family protein [Actinomycetota bacterium]